MARWTITIGNQTLFSFSKCWVEEDLNAVGTWEVDIVGADSTIRGQVLDNATITIYRDSTLMVSGVVYHVTYFQGGGIIATGFNGELVFTEAKCPITAGTHTKVYSAATNNTIFADLVGGVSGWTANTAGSTGATISSFRTSDSMSVWSGIVQLQKMTGQDVYFDRANLVAYLVDKKGTANVFSFNEGIDISDITYDRTKPKAAKVVVYGAGDGVNQIIGSAGSGTPVVEVTDKNIIDTTSANARATKELALILQSIKQYTFDCHDVNNAVVVGDSGKITAPSLGLNSEAVDTTQVIRGVNDKGIETLSVEVTNTEFRTTTTSRQEAILAASKNAMLSDTAMQGSGNALTWTNAINANSTAGNVVEFYVSDSLFKDQAGNLKITQLRADVSISEFRYNVGTATSTATLGSPTGLTGTVGDDSDKLVANTSDGFYFGISSDANWVDVATTFGIDFKMGYFTITSQPNSNGSQYYFRVKNTTNGHYFPNSTGTYFFANMIQQVLNTDIPPVAINLGLNCTILIPVGEAGNGDIFKVQCKAPDDAIDGYVFFYGVDAHNHSDNFVVDPQLVATTFTPGVSTAATVNATGGYIYVEYYEDKAITNNESAGAGVTVEMANTGSILAGSEVWFDGRISGHPEWAYVNSVVPNVSINVDLGTSKSAGDHVTWNIKYTYSLAALRQENIDMGAAFFYTPMLPNAAGWWRMRLITNSTTPDFTVLTVRIKHSMDN